MSHLDLFREAIAAKLKGDDVAFVAAIKEAIKLKTRGIVNEGKVIAESGFYRDQAHGIEQVADNSYLLNGPFDFPEGAVANLPAGQYCFVVDVKSDEQSDAHVTLVQVFRYQEDQILAELIGREAEEFAGRFIGQDVIASIVGHVTSRHTQDDRDNW